MKLLRYSFLFFVTMLTALISNAFTGRYSDVQILGSTVTPTKTPVKAFYEFKKGSYNTIPPQNILDEVFFYVGGGGVICDPSVAIGKLNIAAKPQGGFLMTQSTMIVCGWEKDEVLNGKIVFPNGKEIKSTVVAQENEGRYYGRLDFKPSITDPVGSYTFVLEGKLGNIRQTAYFRKPISPHVFMMDKKNIMLYGFSAFEKVELFYYGTDTRFVGWQEYTMDGTGQSIIKIEVDPKGYFWALGKTGQVQPPFEGGLFGGTSYPESSGILKKDSCASFPPRLKINSAGRVAVTDGLDMRIRSAPGLSQSVIAKVPEGSRFTVLEGPKCVDGIYWWKVTTKSNNITGWMAESDTKTYLLEPMP